MNMNAMRGMQMDMSQQWGGRMNIPPPPPSAPRVLEIRREKVVLHKAESAWKPSVAAGRGKNEEPKDEEQAIIEV
jgi:hypothetical protein